MHCEFTNLEEASLEMITSLGNRVCKYMQRVEMCYVYVVMVCVQSVAVIYG